jgi:hypothetical protein
MPRLFTGLPVPLTVSFYYLTNLAWPLIFVCVALVVLPKSTNLIAGVGALAGWFAYIFSDGCEYREGRPDPKFSRDSWLLKTMRRYLQLTLHRATHVEKQLVNLRGRTVNAPNAIFAIFPHGVNSDFRACLDGMLPEACIA